MIKVSKVAFVIFIETRKSELKADRQDYL